MLKYINKKWNGFSLSLARQLLQKNWLWSQIPRYFLDPKYAFLGKYKPCGSLMPCWWVGCWLWYDLSQTSNLCSFSPVRICIWTFRELFFQMTCRRLHFVKLMSRVAELMSLEMSTIVEGIVALFALEWLFSSVSSRVPHQDLGRHKRFSTLATFLRLLSWVSQQIHCRVRDETWPRERRCFDANVPKLTIRLLMFDVRFFHFPPCTAIFLVNMANTYLAYLCPQGPVGIIWPYKWQNN